MVLAIRPTSATVRACAPRRPMTTSCDLHGWTSPRRQRRQGARATQVAPLAWQRLSSNLSHRGPDNGPRRSRRRPLTAQPSSSCQRVRHLHQGQRLAIPNYVERYRVGEPISSSVVESAVNQVVSKRMVKKQQMRWSRRGAHLLLQVRTGSSTTTWPMTMPVVPELRSHLTTADAGCIASDGFSHPPGRRSRPWLAGHGAVDQRHKALPGLAAAPSLARPAAANAWAAASNTIPRALTARTLALALPV